MGFSFREDSAGIFHPSRIKTYPDGSREILSCSRAIFRDPGWELADKSKDSEKSGGSHSSEQNLERSARRAAAKIRDLALCNDFVWFVTLTLDQSKIDRYDISSIVRRLNVWLDNLVRRSGLLYVLIPELHKDGAIHFHGLFNDIPGMVPSGTWDVPGCKKPRHPKSKKELAIWQADQNTFHEIFNFQKWPYGFTTALRLYGSRESAVAYVCKYITKQVQTGKIGGRFYYSGGALRLPTVERVDYTLSQMMEDYPEFYHFEIEDAKLLFGMVREKLTGEGDAMIDATAAAEKCEFT